MAEGNRPLRSPPWGLRPTWPLPYAGICFQKAQNIQSVFDFVFGKLLPFVRNQVLTTFRKEQGMKIDRK
jgi:hypothetical protein